MSKMRRPFHESVIPIIGLVSSGGLGMLAHLITTTKIPKGHDEIIAAWNKRRQELNWGERDLGVPADLLDQKREAEEGATKKAEAKEGKAGATTS